jgi:H+-transporting ATPase
MTASPGLSSPEAERLLREHGPNTIAAPKASFLAKALRWAVSPMSLLLLAAAGLSFYIGRSFDGWFILALYLANFFIARWHEAKADQAIATLQHSLAVRVKTLRDGTWQSIASEELVPGDIVRLAVGNIVPADIEATESKNLSINEAALTGESLPRDKKDGETVYTGSFVTTGSLTGSVSATGGATKFGKTVTMVDDKPKHSALDKDILTISKYLTGVSLLAAAIVTSYLLFRHQPLADLLTLDLSVLIAGVPVALPTVMSMIISLGVLQLTRRHVIVRRLSSLEDLADVNLLLSDKTGTLTKNEIAVEEIIAYAGTQDEVILWARAATAQDAEDPINLSILSRAKGVAGPELTQIDLIPADSERKRSTAQVKDGPTGYTVSLGAPQIVESLCKLTPEEEKRFEADVAQAAERGYRCLAVASAPGEQEKELKLLGLLMLSDTLRTDAAEVIRFLEAHGIETKMMTGDNRAIASRVSQTLGLRGETLAAAGHTDGLSEATIESTGAFAEVLPDDKFRIVKAAASCFVVAATGDGVNDLPALKESSVGVAVKNAVDALKSSADIVLLTDGIGVIRDAIIEARKIFARTYSYTVYRISESFRLILTIAILSLLNGTFPLTAVQIILLALLNDLPIITLAYDRVTPTVKPSQIRVRQRFELASLFGVVGIFTSVLFYYLLSDVYHLSQPVIQTMFFLKLAVSGHLLIYVAHTEKRWWRWLPAAPVIWATSLTQLAASLIALSGLFFQGISLWQVLLVWVWALLWMQVAEGAKWAFQRLKKEEPEALPPRDASAQRAQS